MAAPDAYSSVIAQECIKAAGPLATALTLERLQGVMKTQYMILSKGKWSAKPQMEIQHRLAGIDQEQDNEDGLKMDNISKMIEEAVKKAIGNQGVRWDDGQRGGNDHGGGQCDRRTNTQIGATMLPELVAILLNNQKPRNTEGNGN